EILDTIHSEFPFFQYGDDIVIPYLLQFYGDTERQIERFEESGYNPLQLGFYLTNMLFGIDHCIRWIKAKKDPNILPIQGQPFPLNLCADFVMWGMQYHKIAQEFVIW